MKQFENGILWYTKGQAQVDVFFPEDKIKCQYCPFCRSEVDLQRFWCRLNNQMIYNPMSLGVPEDCPIEFTGEIVGTKNKGGKQ